MTKHQVLVSLEGDYKISKMKNLFDRLKFDLELLDKNMDIEIKYNQILH